MHNSASYVVSFRWYVECLPISSSFFSFFSPFSSGIMWAWEMSQLQHSSVPLKFPLPDVNFATDAVPIYWVFYYLLSTQESYGPTAQHMQDSPIFFIQPNYVHKQNKVLPPYVNSLATRSHNTGNSTSSFSIQPYCIAAFWQQLFFLSAKISFNTWCPSISFVGFCWVVYIGMHLGIF